MQTVGREERFFLKGLRASLYWGAFELHAKNMPNKVMLKGESLYLTYRECLERVKKLINGLSSIGLVRGDRLALILGNQPEFIESYLACMFMGVIPLMVGHRPPSEIEGILLGTPLKAIIVDRQGLPLVKRFLQECRLKEEVGDAFILTGIEGGKTAFYHYQRLLSSSLFPKRTLGFLDSVPLFYTSGTTGMPKGVFRKRLHEGLASFILASLAEFGFHPEERHLIALPLHHSAPFFFSMLTVLIGGTLFLERAFHPRSFLKTLQQEAITSAYVSPVMLRELLAMPREVQSPLRRFPDLRIVICAGAPLFPETKSLFIQWLGERLCEFYGSTEGGINLYMPPREMSRQLLACGRAFPGNDLKIMDEKGNECPEGVAGELFIKNPWMIDAYERDNPTTRKAFIDGYIGLGDLMVKDHDGYYSFIENKANAIPTEEGIVYPNEVERLLCSHGTVSEAAVIGIPSARKGKDIVAFIVPKPGTTLDTHHLEGFLKEHLDSYKVPREFYITRRIPRNLEGKVSRGKISHSWLLEPFENRFERI